MLLTITIPTYNRAQLLHRCLMRVLPQVEAYDDVEVLVIDNASTDHTTEVVEGLAQKYPYLRYVRNPKNLGYSGSQAKCIELANGRYAAILCDDDVYRDDALATIYPVLSKNEYSFVAINYFGFNTDPEKPTLLEVTKQEDQFSENAYSIFEIEGVGHYSGFIFNVPLAQRALSLLLQDHELSDFEKQRGIFYDIIMIATRSSDLPGYFIGKTIMGAGMPPTIDYDSLRHICMDYYQMFLRNFQKGFITKEELDRRARGVIQWLPKALLRNGGSLSAQELESITNELRGWFGENSEFQRTCKPILFLLKFSIIRAVLRQFIRFFKIIKRAR